MYLLWRFFTNVFHGNILRLGQHIVFVCNQESIQANESLANCFNKCGGVRLESVQKVVRVNIYHGALNDFDCGMTIVLIPCIMNLILVLDSGS